MIKVLVVDDQYLIRAGVKRLLDDVSGIKVIADAESGEDAVRKARELQPAVVLMDVKMPGIGGLEATRKITRLLPDLKVLVLSSLSAEPYPTRLLQAGAAGYITKNSSVDELVKAIRAVNVGQRYISSGVAQELALKHVGATEDSPFDALSERELQVMLMIVRGEKVQIISERLCLSSKTVNSYRYRLFEKLHVHNDVELTHLALRYRLLDQPQLEETNS